MDVGVDLEIVGHGTLSQCGSRPAFLTTAAHIVDVGFEPRVEFLRRARDRLAAELDHALAGNPGSR